MVLGIAIMKSGARVPRMPEFLRRILASLHGVRFNNEPQPSYLAPLGKRL